MNIIKLNRNSRIEGKCKYFNSCKNNFNKDFIELVKTGLSCSENKTRKTVLDLGYNYEI